MKTPFALILVVVLSLAASASAQTAKTESAPESVFKKLIDKKLVAVDGKRVGKYEMAQEPEMYAFYFSAHWCPPCRTFTPKLVDFYNANEAKKTKFEIIFVSSDNDEKSMEDYMLEAKMPWPAINFRSVERLKEIKKLCGDGIPCLVLVDREGKVLSDSYKGKDYLGPVKVMNDMGKLTAK